MLKKIGLPMMALAGMMAVTAAKPASAQVRFGVGAAPAYGVAPAYNYDPSCSAYNPYNAPVYTYQSVSPYVYGVRGDRDHDDWDRGHDFHARAADRGGDAHRGGESFHGGRGRR